jgi:hypothetical protein
MPQDVTKEITVRNLRLGDRFADTGTPVTGVTRRQKWAIVELNDERTIRARLDDTVNVVRSEPTDEERRAQEDEYKRDSLVSNLRKMLDDRPLQAIDEAIDEVRTQDGEDAYDVLTWRNLPGILKTQALYRQALAIRGRLHRGDNEHVNLQDATLDELVGAYAQWYYDNVDRSDFARPRVDPTSRSTSSISNLLEDLNTWAVQEVAYRIMWSGARDDVLARVETFKVMDRNR